MRQVEIPKYGEPGVLRLIERPDPECGPGEVRIRVRAAGINFADVLARMGLYQDAPKPPMVMGYEVAGEIDAVGAGVDEHRVGERVLTMIRFGGHSSCVTAPVDHVFTLPAKMSFEKGAALPVVYLTAYHMLIYLGNLHPGERVLIHSAGGGVGLAAIQLARDRRAELFGTASAGKHERLRALGVRHLIDYTREDFEKRVAELTDGRGVHIVLDAIGGRYFGKSYRCLAKNGRLFCFGISALAPAKHRKILHTALEMARTPIFHPVPLMMKNRGVFGVNMGQLWDEPEVMRGEMQELLRLFEKGVVDPVVDRAFAAADAARAHHYIQDRKNFGKVVLTFDPP